MSGLPNPWERIPPMSLTEHVFGPTLEELRAPSSLPAALAQQVQAAADSDPLHPLNLYRVCWRQPDGSIPHVVMPSALTGVDAPIVVLSGRRFPTGSHKVGPAYSIVREHQLRGVCEPGVHRLVFPSTGNFGIGGAWVGPRMNYASTVVLPEEMSAERFEKIEAYGAQVVKTPGCESNVKEIYDKVAELRRQPNNRILNQFEEFGNYRFHYHVTGNNILELVSELFGPQVRPAAFVSAMGSAGTIAAGDRLKQVHAGTALVGLEPIQCPTLYNVGYGGHRIEGIGDKHATWIHHVTNMDYLMCIDDEATLRGTELLQAGGTFLMAELGLDEAAVSSLIGVFGPSGICNVLGAIKTARLLGLSASQPVVTIATDGFDRYPSVIRKLAAQSGPQDLDEARRRIELFRGAGDDYILEGTPQVRRRWHNQKYFTWVEQQGKSLAELEQLLDPDFWVEQQDQIGPLDARWRELRAEHVAV